MLTLDYYHSYLLVPRIHHESCTHNGSLLSTLSRGLFASLARTHGYIIIGNFITLFQRLSSSLARTWRQSKISLLFRGSFDLAHTMESSTLEDGRIHHGIHLFVTVSMLSSTPWREHEDVVSSQHRPTWCWSYQCDVIVVFAMMPI